MHWMFYAAGTALILATADFMVKLSAGRLSNSLALLIFGLCTSTIALGWIIWERTQGQHQFAQTKGVFGAAAVGICFTFVTLGLYNTFGAGAPVSLGSPLIRLGGLLLASLAGLFILQESFNWQYALGMVLAILGIYLIITR